MAWSRKGYLRRQFEPRHQLTSCGRKTVGGATRNGGQGKVSSCQAGVEASDNAHAPPFPPCVLCLDLVPKYPAIGAGRRASPQETLGKKMKNGEGIGSERWESRSACVHWQVSSQRSFPGTLGSAQIPVCHYSQPPCPSQDTQCLTLRSEP